MSFHLSTFSGNKNLFNPEHFEVKTYTIYARAMLNRFIYIHIYMYLVVFEAFFNFRPYIFGERSNLIFDLRIFFNWVRKTTN